MKTKTNLLRLLAGLLLITVIQINVSSEDFELRSSEVMYYSFLYDYPVDSYLEMDLYDWMICPSAFENDEYYHYLSLDWLGYETGLVCCPSCDLQLELEQCCFIDELFDDSKEMPVMRWMLCFEPTVLDFLLEDVKPELLEKWMYGADAFMEDEDLSPQMNSWMLVEDLGIVKSQLEFEFWMIKTFSVN